MDLTIEQLLELRLHDCLFTTTRHGVPVTIVRVPGGWLYTTTHQIDAQGSTIEFKTATTFVPEPPCSKR